MAYMYFVLDNSDEEFQICPQELNVSPLILFSKVEQRNTDNLTGWHLPPGKQWSGLNLGQHKVSVP